MKERKKVLLSFNCEKAGGPFSAKLIGYVLDLTRYEEERNYRSEGRGIGTNFTI